MNENLPPAPDGALVYVHPQGKTIFVLPDGNMVCYKPDGKRATTSATPEKLATGHGGWELYSGEAPTATTPAPAANAYGLAPMLAESAEMDMITFFVTDAPTVMEQKVDGDRVLLDTTNNDFVARTRNGKPYSKGLPMALRRFASELPQGIIIDGELVGSTYWAFDLPVAPDGATDLPLWARRECLEALAPRLGPVKIIPQARTMNEKHALARTAITDGYEGVMAKNRNSAYVGGGRTRDWIKLKFVKTADVVVMPKTAKRKTAESVAVGVYVNGVLTEVGHASLIGKQKQDIIVEGAVLEVKYLYVGANGRLYQPRIVRLRNDKFPDECTDAQLVHVNKKVLEQIP